MLGKPKLLVVDDYEPNRTIYRDALLRIPDIEVVEANNGHQALELARAGGFAMYLLDINMPDMDGFEVASMLRQLSEGESIPIVFATSEADSRQYQLRGYRMGATDFVGSAPLRTEILVQKARFFLRMYQHRQDLQRSIETVQRQNKELQAKLDETLRQQEKLRAQATHDALTNLPNRSLFQDRLHAAVARARRASQHVALVYIDLDGFKAVNDKNGHGTGDALLVAVANRLLKSLRETDTVARIGGDEFAMVIEGLDSVGGAEYVAAKVYGALTQSLVVPSQAEQRPITLRPDASIGVAVYPEHADDAQELLVRADMTMYEAKRSGGGLRIHGEMRRSEAFVPLQLIRAREEQRKGK